MSDDFNAVLGMAAHGQIIEKRSKLLADFLREHGLADPKSVEYNPLRGCVMSRCFRNVAAQMSLAGGKMETGWAFFELVDISIRTVAHAIWIMPTGKRMDITPWPFPPDGRILFLPDERVAYKRGYTAGYRTVFAKDARVRAMELFEGEIDLIFDSVCTGVDSIVDIPTLRFMEAAQRAGVPWEVASEVAKHRMSSLGH